MSASVTCPTCGQLWPWNAQTAGRQARCRCGKLIHFPAAAPVAAVEEVVDTATEDPWSQPLDALDIEAASNHGDSPPLPDLPTPPPAPLPLDAVPPGSPPRKVRLSGTLPYRSTVPGRLEPVDRQKILRIGSPGRDFWLPLTLVVTGLLLYFGRAFYVNAAVSIGSRSVATVFATAIIQLILNGVITISVVLIFGKIMDMDYGTTTGTALKLGAISIFPQAVCGAAFMMVGTCMGALAVCLLSLGLMLPLFSILFSIGLAESVMCVLTVTVMEVFSWEYVSRVVDAMF